MAREAKLLLGQDSDSDEPDAKKAPDQHGEDLPGSKCVKIPLVYRGIQKFRTWFSIISLLWYWYTRFRANPSVSWTQSHWHAPTKKNSFINEKWHIQPATLEIRCLFGAPFEPYPATQPRDDSMLFFYVRGWPVHNVHNGFTRVRFLALNHWFNENKAVCVFFTEPWFNEWI